MKKIYIGPLPPPLGGISVYLYRLKNLEKESIFLDIGKEKKYSLVKKIIKSSSDSVFILQGMYFNLLLLLLLFKKNYKIVIHNGRFGEIYNQSNFIKKYFIKYFLIKSKEIQVLNNKEKKVLLNIIKKEKVVVKNAFLPPPLIEEMDIRATYSNELNIFLERAHPLIIANAYKLVLWNNIDLYGLDMCVTLIEKLKKIYPNIGLIFAIANDDNKEYKNQILKRIKEKNIEENIFFLTGQKEIWPLFKNVDLMIRPTVTDGYGNSIAEALYFNCSAIASDVCERPKGTILFKNRDEKDFYFKVKNFLELKMRCIGNDKM